MDEPSTGSQLQQFICAMQWVRACIPKFSQFMEPLRLFMEKVYKKAPKRTKAAVGRIDLQDLQWSETEQKYFTDVKLALSSQVRLAHYDF